MRRNPLYRALRVDKMTIAALDVVLAEHERGRLDGIPVLRMLEAGAAEIAARAGALAEALRPLASEARVELRPGTSAVGGGAAPDVEIDTTLIGVTHPTLSAERLAERLRGGTPPVVARVAQDRVWLDLRTVQPHEETELRDALVSALRS
jgi:L-seryl-tRNA(Ser) seleniumtransferase